MPAAAVAAVLYSGAFGQSTTASDPLVSKSIPKIFAVADQFFAFDEFGKSFSRLDLFSVPPRIKNGTWPWPGSAADGVTWKNSLLLRSDSTADSARVSRIASLLYDGTFKSNSGKLRNDSLILPLGDAGSVARGSGLTAMAVWHDTLILGFGKLGLTYAHLAPDTGDALFRNDSIAFSSIPSSGNLTANLITPCVWNQKCRADTIHIPVGGLDSILALTVDSSASDSIWLLVATKSGLRRGLLGGTNFPRVAGISDSDIVQNFLSSPDHTLLWAFTDTHFFFSHDHGRSFKIPDTISGITTTPSLLKGYAPPGPQAVAWGDTTFVNFNLPDRPGLVLFKKDSLQKVNPGAGEISDVLLDAADSLNITHTEGSLTRLAIARLNTGEAVLAVGSTVKGIFYKRLDGAGTTFANLNLLRKVKGSLNEIITFPTLFGSEMADGVPKPVHLGYRLAKDGKVTITVFNYAMEKVRTVVRDAPRRGGIARSENPAEDKWDGTDASGRYVSVGVYYILVESDKGERGFGKAISVWGRK